MPMAADPRMVENRSHQMNYFDCAVVLSGAFCNENCCLDSSCILAKGT